MLRKFISSILLLSLLTGNLGGIIQSVSAAPAVGSISPGGVFSNLAFWVRAEDATLENNVMKLPDISGNNINLVSPSADRSPAVSNKNNQKSLVFDGNNDVLVSENNAKLWENKPNFTAFFVGGTKDNRTTQTVLAHGETRNINDGMYLALHPTGAFVAAEDKNFFFQNTNRTNNPSIVKWNIIDKQSLSIGINGKTPITQPSHESNNTTGDKKVVIGNLSTDSSGFGPYTGDYNEMIVFNRQVSENDSQKILSYLACKYSQPLDQTTPNNYLNSNGDIIWDASKNTQHKNAPICLLRDDTSGINKTTSTNLFDSKDIKLSTTSLENNRSLLWSHNGDSFEIVNEKINPKYWRIKKEWRVSEVLGDTGEITITVPFSAFPNIRKDKKLFLVRNNGENNFSKDTTEFIEGTTNVATQEYTFKTNLQDNDYFTFAFGREAGPGGVTKTTLTSWFKADTKYSQNGGKTVWGSDSIYEIDATDNSGNGPTLSQETINFEKQLDFKQNTKLSTEPLSLDGFLNAPAQASGKMNGSIFVVYKATNPTLWALIRQAQRNEIYSLRLSENELEYKAREGGVIKSLPTQGKHNIYASIIETPNGSDTAHVKSYINGVEKELGTIDSKYIYEQKAPILFGPTYIGQVAEIISYSTPLNQKEREQVETYLSCKYGLSLAQGTNGRNYLNSKGNAIWDVTENTGYAHNVACVVRDDIAALNKTISQSQETLEGNIIVRSQNIATDGTALLWSDNGWKINDFSLLGAPEGKKISKKIVRFSEKTGDLGEVDILINKNDLSYFNGKLQLAVKNGDANFTEGVKFYEASEEWDKYKFTLNVKNGDYAALTITPTPLAEPALWFKANKIETQADKLVNSWKGNHNFEFKPSTNTKPVKEDNIVNFNPAVKFENSPLKATKPYVFDTSKEYDVFTVVVNKDNKLNGPLFVQNGEKKSNPSIGADAIATVSDERTNLNLTTTAIPTIKAQINGIHYTYSNANNTSTLITSKNGKKVGEISENITPLQSSQIKQTFIGGNGEKQLTGYVAEIVGYNKKLSQEEKEKAISYLAIKYGITPEEGNLVLSNNSKIYERDNDYKYNITAIAKDDTTELNQPKSKTVNDNKDLTLEKQWLQNGQGASIASNNKAYVWTGVNRPLGYYGYEKVWKYQEGVTSLGSVNIYVDNNSLTTGFGGKLQMYISDTEDFTAAKILQATLKDGVWEFKDVDLKDNQYFTIGYYSNVPPTDVMFSNNTYVAEIPENKPVGTEVATLKGIDGNNDPLTYSLTCATPSANDASFSIEGDKLKTKEVFDFEARRVYKVCVRVKDIVGSTFDKELTVNVTNVNEAPTDITLSSSFVTENNRVGVSISNINTTDGDSNSFTYSLVAGDGDEDNASFSIAGDKLIIGIATDYEKKQEYKIRIKSSDNEGLSFEKSFVINVQNVDDTAPEITVTQGVYLGPASSNVVKFGVKDIEDSGLQYVGYAYSPDKICSNGDTYTALNVKASQGKNEYIIPHDDESKNGNYFCILAKDGANNQKYYISDNKFYIRTTPPYQPVITSPDQTKEGITNTKRPTITGTIEVGTKTFIKKQNKIICKTDTPATGTDFSCSITEDLEEGLNSLTAYSCDTAVPTPNCSGEKPFIITVDTIAPGKPKFFTPIKWNYYKTVGSAIIKTERNAKVEVLVFKGNQQLAKQEGFANDAGDINLPLGVTFRPDGNDYKIKARTIDTAGNSGDYEEVSFIIDTTPPANPTIKTPTLNGTVNTKQPTITGEHAEPKSKLVLTYTNKENVVKVIETDVHDDGHWSIAIQEDLKESVNTFSIYLKDKAWNKSQEVSHSFKIDTIPPSLPTVTSPKGYINTRTFTLTGNGSADDNIEIKWGTHTENVLIANTGVWKHTFTATDDGEQVFEIRSFDANGNYTEKVDHKFYIDTNAPAKPQFVNPNSDIKSNNKSPTFILSGEKNIKTFLKILKGSEEIDTLTIDASDDGSIMLTTTKELDNAIYTIQAYQIDKAQNMGAVASIRYEVDTNAPDKPVVKYPENLAILNTGTFNISGTAEENSKIHISIGTEKYESNVDSDGRFSVRVTGLNDGSYVATLYAEDQQGNKGATTITKFTVDTVAPIEPTISPKFAIVNTKTPAITGTAEANSIIHIGDTTCVTNKDGAFSCASLSTPLQEGNNQLVVKSCDLATPLPNCSQKSFNISVDTTPPALPSFTAPVVNSILNTNRPVFKGTATEVGAKVKIVVDGKTFTWDVSNRNEINVTATEDLKQGEHEAVITISDNLGNESKPIKLRFYIDTETPEAPTVTSPKTPFYTQADTFTIKGKAEAKAKVLISFNGEEYEGDANADGDYSIGFTDSRLVEKEYTLSVKQKDLAGNISEATSIKIVIDRTSPELPTITSHNNGDVVTSKTITLTGTAVEATGKVVFQIGKDKFEKEYSGNKWTLEIPGKLKEGNNILTYWQEDIAENYSNPKGTYSIIVDTLPPEDAVIETPSEWAILNTKKPSITFRGEALSKYTLSVGGHTYEGTINNNGDSVTITPTTDLNDGNQKIEVKLTDKFGNKNPNKAIRNFTIDTSAPGNVIITSPQNAYYKDDFNLEGTGEANSEIIVTNKSDNSQVGKVTISAGNAFSLPIAGLSEGIYTFIIKQKDQANNWSQGVEYTFTVDKTKPVITELTIPEYSKETDIAWNLKTSEDGVVAYTIKDSSGTIYVNTATKDTTNKAANITTSLHPNKEYIIEIFVTDKAGNISDTISKRFIVDTIPPTPVNVIKPVNNAESKFAGVDVSFTAEDNATIEIYVGDKLVKTISNYTTGTYTENGVDLWLNQGLNIISFVQKDKAGNKSLPTKINYSIDTEAPKAPIIANISNNQAYSQALTQIEITGEAFSKFKLTLNNQAFNGTIDADGKAVIPLSGLTEGDYTIKVTLTDKAGNTSNETTVNFSLDTTPPASPTLTLAPIYNKKTINGLTGTAEAKSRVQILKKGVVLCSTEATDTSSFTCNLADLDEGKNELTIKSCDTALPTANCSENKAELLVDTIAPRAPIINYPADKSTHSVNNVTLKFTSPDRDNVTYKITRSGMGNPITGTVPPSKEVAETFTNLSEGEYNVTISLSDNAGNTSQSTVTFNVKTTPPAAPTVTSPKQPKGYITAGNFYVKGKAEKLSQVKVHDKKTNRLLSSCVSDADRNYSCALRQLTDEKKEIYVVTCDFALPINNCSAKTSANLEVDTVPPPAIQILTPANGIQLTSPNIRLSLKGEPGLEFEAKVDGKTIKNILNNKGEYSIQITLTNLRADEVVVTAFDEAGNKTVSKSSYTYNGSSWNSGNNNSWGGGWGGGGGWAGPVPVAPSTPSAPSTPNNPVSPISGGNAEASCRLEAPSVVQNGEKVLIGYTMNFVSEANVNLKVDGLKIGNGVMSAILPHNNKTNVVMTVKNAAGRVNNCSISIESKDINKGTDTNNSQNNNTFKPGTCKYVIIPNNKIITKDITNNWAKSYIILLIATRSMTKAESLTGNPVFTTKELRNGIVNNAEYFNPNNNLTRAEFLKMLIRAMACSYDRPSNMNHRYTDVQKGIWYEEYVTYARQNGWIGNNGETKFNPNQSITRAEVAKIIANATKLPLANVNKSSFVDVSQKSEFKQFIEALAKEKIISGQVINGKLSFRPNDNISRAEMSKILYNTFLKGNIITNTTK